MRLIDADDIVKYSHDVILQGGARHRCFDVTLLHEIPTVEKHGHWVQGDRDFLYACSNCEEMTANAIFYGFNGEKYMMNYCPNCGAKMDEVKDESNEV